MSPIARILGSRKQDVEAQVAPLTITLNGSLSAFLLPVPATLGSSGLEVLVPKEGTLPPGNRALISFNWQLRMLPGHFGLLMPVDPQVMKGVTVMSVVIDPNYQEESGLVLHNGGKEEYVLNPEDPVGNLSTTMTRD
ncbi:putative inactive deoxyuridine 5'-triphosphate nucleotidohydrolase-like protein FLJ16323 [Tenrec ecaudatus]|uniref:putative inactive deoxyuridine 5'-triphosphate nucleotidohydrolase-like protein FLJ16323 n=1 Tax=Tenrec ecaudatus TaxID=94439 RepID=UPI003F599F64